jgi:hypothetical protein
VPFARDGSLQRFALGPGALRTQAPLAGSRLRAVLAQSAEAERRRPRRHHWRGASTRDVHAQTWTRPCGGGSVWRDGRVGVHVVSRVCLALRRGLFPHTTGHAARAAEAAGLRVARVCAACFQARTAAGSAPCSPPDGMPPAGGRPDRSHGSAGLRHRPPRPWDALASRPSRDLRPVRTPPLTWGSARPS